MSILKSYAQLSEEQRKLINFCNNTDENIFLEGPPWSGKALVCLYSLQNIVKENGIGALFMVSNNAMYGYMSIALKELGINDDVSVDSKNSIFWKMASEYRISVDLDLNYHENYDSILRSLLDEEEIEKRYGLIIVSEVQDYLPREWELIKRISKRIICYGDFKQAVYKNKVDIDVITKDCIHKKLKYLYNDISTDRLKRVRKYFFKDSEFIDIENVGSKALRADRDNGVYAMSVGYKVVDVKYEDEFKAIADTLEVLEKKNSRVAVICPNNNKFAELSIYLQGFDIEHNYYEINQDLRHHDFTSTIPLFISVFNAEGLQFDDVILFGFHESNYIIDMKRKEDRLWIILYVGLTRARNSTYIIRSEDTVKELKDFKEEYCLEG